MSRPEYSRCPRESGCWPRKTESLKPDELLLPKSEFFGRAQPYCEYVGKRIPLLEEVMWAIAGGTEDRLYPWGNAPLDKTRAPVYDAADRQRGIDDVYEVCKEEGLDKAFCETTGDMVELRARTAFHWDDGLYPYSHPLGSMPAGNGRWGHADLMRPAWVVFGTDPDRGKEIVGRCGFIAAPHSDGSAPTFHDSECSQFSDNCPPCRKVHHRRQSLRCATAPTSSG